VKHFADFSPSAGAQEKMTIRRRWFTSGYALALCLVLIANLLRNIAQQVPQQLGDETSFLLSSKYFLQWDLVHSLGYVPVPGLVFLKLASLIASSNQYYLLAKVWNAILLTAATIPAYTVARRVMPATQAKLASILVAVVPSIIYGAYFTPEAAYILAFWIFVSISIAALNAPNRMWIAAAAGSSCAVAYLIKPHALALGAAYVLSVVALWLVARLDRRGSAHGLERKEWNSIRVALIHLAFFAIAAIVTIMLLGRMIAADWLAGFDLKLYSNLVTARAEAAAQPAMTEVIRLLGLHAAAIVSALAIPVVLAAFTLRRWSVSWDTTVVLIVSFAVMSMLVLMTAKVTVDFHAIHGPEQALDRIHGRYYSFALPLLMFVTVAGLSERAPHISAIRATTVFVMAVAVVVACTVLTARQTFSFVDAPDLTYLVASQRVQLFSVLVAVVVFALAAFSRVSPGWLVLASWGCMSIVNVYAATRLQLNEAREHTGDRAVALLRALFESRGLDHGVIVSGAHRIDAARAAFRLASTSPVVSTLSEAYARIGENTQWLLILGDQPRAKFGSSAIRAGDSTVYLADGVRVATFGNARAVRTRYSFNGDAFSLADVVPAHSSEPWGTWLSAPWAELIFPQPLPAEGTLTIVARVLDPTLQTPISVLVCGRSLLLQINETFKAHQIQYSCATGPEFIRFENMKPLSPRELGLSSDPRRLALGIEAIEIESKPREAR
jgi:phosphoglycerol transferase